MPSPLRFGFKPSVFLPPPDTNLRGDHISATESGVLDDNYNNRQ